MALPPLTEADVRQLLDSLALEGIDSAALAGPLARAHGRQSVLRPRDARRARGAARCGTRSRLPTAPSVGALIERRLAQLSPAALRLARVAALAGADFSAALAAHVLQSHPLDLTEAWAELERAHVLRGERLRCTTWCATLRRAPCRGRLPSCFIAASPNTSSAGSRRRPAIAQHYAEAGLWRQAATFNLRAATDCATGVATSRRSRAPRIRDQRALTAPAMSEAAFDARCDSVESLILVRGVEQAQRVIEGMLGDGAYDAQRAAALTARATAALMAADHVTGVASAREALALADGLRRPGCASKRRACSPSACRNRAGPTRPRPCWRPSKPMVDGRRHGRAARALLVRHGLRAELCAPAAAGRRTRWLARHRVRARARRSCRTRDADHQSRDCVRQPRSHRPGVRARVARPRAAGRTRPTPEGRSAA